MMRMTKAKTKFPERVVSRSGVSAMPSRMAAITPPGR
jgi:hypothetical protein